MATDLFKTLNTISAFHYYNFWIYKNIAPYLSGSVLDVGSGIGEVAKYFKQNPLVTKIILSDGTDEMLTVLRNKFTEEPFQVMKLDLTMPAPSVAVDTITCINVLEHIEDDPQTLTYIRPLLKNNGRMVLVVPAVPAIYGTLDSLVGHYRRYTGPMTEKLFSQAGFVIEKKFYMNMFGIISWFFAGRILKQSRFEPVPCSLLDKLVPVFQMMESVCPPPIGQSLIVVGRKA